MFDDACRPAVRLVVFISYKAVQVSSVKDVTRCSVIND